MKIVSKKGLAWPYIIGMILLGILLVIWIINYASTNLCNDATWMAGIC